MAKKDIFFGNDARTRLKDGVDKLANAVRVTLGPKGMAVIIKKHKYIFTKDGVTVARDIELRDPMEQIGAELAKEVAWDTDRAAGDGTTTAVILVQAIFRQGMSAIAAGIDPHVMKAGMEWAMNRVLEQVKKMARPVKGHGDISNVATIAPRDREIGDTIADIIGENGEKAVIAVEEHNRPGLFKEVVNGIQFDQGWLNPNFITHSETMEAVLENAHILVTSQVLSENSEIVELMAEIARKSEKKNLLVIADDVKGEALATFVVNKMRDRLNTVCVAAPMVGDNKQDTLADIATLTGATHICEETGLRVAKAKMEHLGSADRVIVSREGTLIIGGKGSKKDISARVAQIDKILEDNKGKSEYKAELMEERRAQMTGGVAIIKVGGLSDAENTEKRYRIEDAVRATRSAIEEGVVPGGGMALLRASESLEREIEKNRDISYRMGVDIIYKAIQEPAYQIIANTGVKPEVKIERVKNALDKNFGYDSMEGEYVDMLKAGIIDPAKVVRVALENAVSVVSLFLITEACIVDDEKPEKAQETNECE